MTLTQSILTIGIVVLGTMITRFLPFLLFPSAEKTPKFIRYLGDVLPYSAMGLLVIYCLKDVAIESAPYGIPELLSILIVVLLHKWKENMLLSIGIGTIFYMFLVQVIF